MKPHVILLLNADSDIEAAASEAAIASRHGVRTAKTAADAFHALSCGLEDVDAVIVDLDPEIHGAAILSALGGLDPRVPVIAVTSLELSYMEPIARRHGAAICLAKPVAPELLAETLKQLRVR